MLQESDPIDDNISPYFMLEIIQNSKLLTESWNKQKLINNDIYNTLIINAKLKYKEQDNNLYQQKGILQTNQIHSIYNWLTKSNKELFFYHLQFENNLSNYIFPRITSQKVFHNMLKDLKYNDCISFQISIISINSDTPINRNITCLVKLHIDSFILCEPRYNDYKIISSNDVIDYIQKLNIIKNYSDINIEILVMVMDYKPTSNVYNTCKNLINKV